MADAISERRRILDMLANGQIKADEAEQLLLAVAADESVPRGPTQGGRQGGAREAFRAPPTPEPPGNRRKIARSLRIVIDSGDEEQGKRDRVNVTVPIALARFAGKLIPEEAKLKLSDEGIDLAAILEALDEELPEGRLVDIDSHGMEDESKRARIIVEVV